MFIINAHSTITLCPLLPALLMQRVQCSHWGQATGVQAIFCPDHVVRLGCDYFNFSEGTVVKHD